MNYVQKLCLLLVVIIMPLMAEDVLKITLTDDVSEVKLSAISKIVFQGDSMIAGSAFALDDIKKIEIVNDNPTKVKTSLPGENIGIHQAGGFLQLSVPQTSVLTVRLYNQKGMLLTHLFSGTAQAGVLNLSFAKENLSAGVYMLLVKNKQVVFLKKIVVK
ncbi:MAG: T9SS type A sorting domain-containing protein [Fibrobacteria bacterium]|nr:T9SS type A sorting domain-containing protein [Fibrobacteria bacterium]